MFDDLPLRGRFALATGAAVIALGVAACGSSGGSTQATKSKAAADVSPPVIGKTG